ncbi:MULTISPECIES: alkaline phosphatase [unclassified Oceanobacter]|uniref:alkaline phosphatase D family protein n=1 Tax=unclassified Oceanobacter TaxID=2620260 RepID=UPI00273437BC|nr:MULTISPECIES: alkaline phosphatase D family protein [unclassified Oceanobacter]MDP2609151.1 alkaline phosphatase D family protein [Oceanobacter sp. 1_MG-2023]MDP2612557.1 alkaline phosphatase D family protein [Oceanobacter sp. 2_MG-2023]
MSRTPDLSRRRFLQSVAGTASAVSVPAVITGCFADDDDDDDSSRNLTVFVFGHGVASGDPLVDAVIIWTRVTPDELADADAEAEVGYVVATDAAMTDVVASGTVYTDASRDYTVKVDVTGLSAGTGYYYQFAGKDGETSTIGQTKTLPEGSIDSVKLAVCSCSNFPAGLFNVYREIANSDADAVIHLGDYLYEYGSNEYPTEDAEGRQPEPTAEITTLAQYRQRYAQYHVDANLQAAHAAKPFICVWDDHELANDTYIDGAENHDETTEGSFSERRDAAEQAYHEWLPIRTGSDNAHIYRAFDFGDLVRLHMLDTRILARSKQLDYADYVTSTGLDTTAFMTDMSDTSRTLLGDEQTAWFGNSLATSGATWDVLGQQVLMGKMYIPADILLAMSSLTTVEDQLALATMLETYATAKYMQSLGMDIDDDVATALATTAPYNLDAWDGYEVARQTLYAQISGQSRDVNLVTLAGDTHNAWASQLTQSGTTIGVEFATPSVTSPGLELYAGFGSDEALQASFESAITTLIDDLEYLNAGQRGFILVTFTAEKASCDWVFVDTIASSSYNVTTGKRMQVLAGSELTLESVDDLG